MKKLDSLSKHDIEIVKERETHAKSMIDALKKAQSFKLGDYLIAFSQGRYDMQPRQLTNSYGAPRKFQVVAVDVNDIPYMKELNKAGVPAGNLISPLKFKDGDRFEYDNEYLFEVDPDYTDAIILQDEDAYDASIIHKEKSETFKAITNYNKSIKIRCDDRKEIADYFDKTVVAGTVLHRSVKTHFTVLETKPVPRDRAGRIQNDNFIKIQDSKGKIKECGILDFHRTALYTQRPRTYSELKDPK